MARNWVLVVKVAAVVVPLAGLLAVMHFVLPSCARWRQQRELGEKYELTETEHLRIWVPRGRRLDEFVAAVMEHFTSELHREYGDALALDTLDDKITVRLFETQEELATFASRRMTRDPSHTIGFYDPATWSVALTLRPPRELLALIFHETTHLVMDRSATLGSPQWSVWLAEGMAVFFEHSPIEQGRVRLGGKGEAHLALVLARARQGRHLPLPELLRMAPREFYGAHSELAYAEAGLLVAYLLTGDGGKHREGFLRYYHEELKPGPCEPDADGRHPLERHLGLPADQLEREWLDYLERELTLLRQRTRQ